MLKHLDHAAIAATLTDIAAEIRALFPVEANALKNIVRDFDFTPTKGGGTP